MPDRSRKRPTDLNALAASIIADSTDEEKPEPVDDGKDRPLAEQVRFGVVSRWVA